MKMLLALLLMTFLGLAGLGTGVAGFLDTEVRCGSRVMAPGDTCTVRGGHVRDYEEHVWAENVESSLAVGFGVMFLLLPAAGVVGTLRYRRRGFPDPTQRRVPPHLEEWARRHARSSPFHR
jgi:hypothetical protein